MPHQRHVENRMYSLRRDFLLLKRCYWVVGKIWNRSIGHIRLSVLSWEIKLYSRCWKGFEGTLQKLWVHYQCVQHCSQSNLIYFVANRSNLQVSPEKKYTGARGERDRCKHSTAYHLESWGGGHGLLCHCTFSRILSQWILVVDLSRVSWSHTGPSESGLELLGGCSYCSVLSHTSQDGFLKTI